MTQREHKIYTSESCKLHDDKHDLHITPAEIYDINHILKETNTHNLCRLLRKEMSQNMQNAITHQLIHHAIPNEIFIFNLKDLIIDKDVPSHVKDAVENHIIGHIIPKSKTTSEFQTLFDNIFSSKVHDAAELYLIRHIIPNVKDIAYLKGLFKKIVSAKMRHNIAQKYVFLSPYDGFSNKLINRKYAARDQYYKLRPDNISMERMQKNIEGLYAPMIEEIIEYSKRAVTELKLAPEDVYSQRFDKNRYNHWTASRNYS